MYNSYYSYENMHLWDAAEWEDRYCTIFWLYRRIEYLNAERYPHPAGSGTFTDRTDGTYYPKTQAVVYDDVIAEIGTWGMETEIYSMGQVNWIPVLPEKGIKTAGGEIPVLVIQQSVDYRDHNWAMDILVRCREYIRQAANENRALLFICSDKPDKDNLFSSILMEFGAMYRTDLDHLYLDVSGILQAGEELEPECSQKPEYWGDIAALNITGQWINRVSNLWGTACAVRSASKDFNLQKHIHSICGRKMAEFMKLEHDFDDAENPKLLAYWESIGLKYESHLKAGQLWVSMAPLCALKQKEEKLPVVMIFREVYKNNGHLPLIAISGFYDYTELAAQGEMILLMFAMEDPDDNDLFYDILQDAADMYPIDLSRVYVTGHSHNGMYAFEFARRHWRHVAAAALQGQRFGLMSPEYMGPPISVPDAYVEQLAEIDLPTIAINGQAENIMTRYPIGSEDHMNAVDAYKRRLRACHCPAKTTEEIVAARTSGNYAIRRLGIPVDEAEVSVVYGRECYIGHVYNDQGKEYFRACTVDNLPHITTPMTPVLSWNYIRRFARNLETGEVIERY